MKLSAVEEIAESLMDKFLTRSGWTFKLNGRLKRTIGYCKHHEKSIELSKSIAQIMSKDEVVDTLLHEIAHANVGPGHGHGFVWKEEAERIGATSEATCKIEKNSLEALSTIGVKWVMVGPNNKIYRHWYRKPHKNTFSKIAYTWINGRKNETYGALEIVPFDAQQLRDYEICY